MNLLLRLIFVQIVFCVLVSGKWENFKMQELYEIIPEDNSDKETFLNNLVEEHNRKYSQGLTTFTIKSNQILQDQISKIPEKLHKMGNNSQIPDSIDWRDYGIINAIVDQGSCESCWAFVITDTIQAQLMLFQDQNISLSPQNLLDCVTSTSSPCTTDLTPKSIDNGYQYVIDHGVDTEESYPYENWSDQGCRFNPETVGAKISGFAEIPAGDEEALKMAVATIGPVAVAVDAHDVLFKLYHQGVYYNAGCSDKPEDLNHSLTIVGYGNEDGQDFWLLRNTWGTFFGDQGYIKMARNRGNNCGVATLARYPVL